MEPIPFDKRSGKIWFDGKPVNWSDVQIHVLSHGLHYASCVFEGERVYDGEIFNLIPFNLRFGSKYEPHSQAAMAKLIFVFCADIAIISLPLHTTGLT